MTYCPFETVIDRTATDDDSQRLNAECIIAKSSEPLHARRRKERHGGPNKGNCQREVSGGGEGLELVEKEQTFPTA